MQDMPEGNKFDETPVAGATLDDLDMQSVEHRLEYALRLGRYAGEARTPLDFMLEQRVVMRRDGQIVPTVAGMLTFGRWPQHFMPHATVTLAHYRGNEINSGDVIHIHEYTGNVCVQIDRVVAYLTESMKHGYMLEGNAQRKDRILGTLLALRELSVNAIAHRDYAIEEPAIRITMFRNRIDWISPGKLPEGITIATILDQQFARNRNLLRLLFQRSYVEKIGQGLDTVFDECRKGNIDPPQMRETGASFSIGLTGQELVGASQKRLKLTDAQLQIITLLQRHGSMSAQEIMTALSNEFRQVRSLRTIQVDLKTLVEDSLVDRLGQTRASTYVLHAL